MSTNMLIISGRIGNDLVVKQFSDGSQVVNMNVAVSDFYTQNGTQMEKTTWVQVAVWGPMAANVAKYKVKGDFVVLTGTVEAPRAYLNKAGKPDATAAMRATSIDFGPKVSQGQPQPVAQAQAQPQPVYAQPVAVTDPDEIPM